MKYLTLDYADKQFFLMLVGTACITYFSMGVGLSRGDTALLILSVGVWTIISLKAVVNIIKYRLIQESAASLKAALTELSEVQDINRQEGQPGPDALQKT